MKNLLISIWNGIKKVGNFLWRSVKFVVVVVAIPVVIALGIAAMVITPALLVALSPIILPIAWLFRVKLSGKLEQYTKWSLGKCREYALYFAPREV